MINKFSIYLEKHKVETTIYDVGDLVLCKFNPKTSIGTSQFFVCKITKVVNVIDNVPEDYYVNYYSHEITSLRKMGFSAIKKKDILDDFVLTDESITDFMVKHPEAVDNLFLFLEGEGLIEEFKHLKRSNKSGLLGMKNESVESYLKPGYIVKLSEKLTEFHHIGIIIEGETIHGTIPPGELITSGGPDIYIELKNLVSSTEWKFNIRYIEDYVDPNNEDKLTEFILKYKKHINEIFKYLTPKQRKNCEYLKRGNSSGLLGMKTESYKDKNGHYIHSLAHCLSTDAMKDYIDRHTPVQVVIDFLNVLGGSNLVSVEPEKIIFSSLNFWITDHNGSVSIIYLMTSNSNLIQFSKANSIKNKDDYYFKLKEVYDWLTKLFKPLPSLDRAITVINEAKKKRYKVWIELFNQLSTPEEVQIYRQYIVKSYRFEENFLIYVTDPVDTVLNKMETREQLAYIKWLDEYDLWTPELESEFQHLRRGDRSGLLSMKNEASENFNNLQWEDKIEEAYENYMKYYYSTKKEYETVLSHGLSAYERPLSPASLLAYRVRDFLSEKFKDDFVLLAATYNNMLRNYLTDNYDEFNRAKTFTVFVNNIEKKIEAAVEESILSKIEDVNDYNDVQKIISIKDNFNTISERYHLNELLAVFKKALNKAPTWMKRGKDTLWNMKTENAFSTDDDKQTNLLYGLINFNGEIEDVIGILDDNDQLYYLDNRVFDIRMSNGKYITGFDESGFLMLSNFTNYTFGNESELFIRYKEPLDESNPQVLKRSDTKGSWTKKVYPFKLGVSYKQLLKPHLNKIEDILRQAIEDKPSEYDFLKYFFNSKLKKEFVFRERSGRGGLWTFERFVNESVAYKK